MRLEGALDLAGASLLVLGAALCLIAAIGLVRLPDVLNRMHAASKPQSLGFLLLCVGLALILRDGAATAMLALAAGLQLVTAPVATQMMAKAAYRTDQYGEATVVVHDASPEDGADPGDLGDGGAHEAASR